MSMNYYFNEKGSLIAVSNQKDKSLSKYEFTNIPIKPLSWSEKTYFKKGKWNYEFENYNRLSNYQNATMQKSLEVFNTLRSFCNIPSGEYVKEKEKNISILIPCYNKSKYILETVISCVNQTMQPYQIIVLLMDLESIKLKQKLQELSPLVTCIESEQKNAVVARNYLVELCQTEYFIFLDADDKLQPNYVEAVYKDKASIVFAKMSKCETQSFIRYGLSQNTCVECVSQNLTCLMCKEAFYEIGLDENLCKGGEDADFILRLFFARKWKISFTFDTYFYYRFDADNSLTASTEFYSSHFKNLKKHKNKLLEYADVSSYYKEPIFDFLKDDNNFVDEETFNKNYNSFFENTENHSDDYNRIFDLLEKSKLQETKNIFSEDNYFVPDDFEQVHMLTGRTFDAIIITKITSSTLYSRHSFVIQNDIKNELNNLNLSDYDKLIYLLENYCVFYYPVTNTQPYFDKQVLNHLITFTLDLKCNAKCEYCSQEKDRNNITISDNEIFERFEKALSKVEQLYNYKIIPQIVGGEPTLWSKNLIKRIIHRLERYNTIFLMTNRIIKNSEWENCNKVVFYTHLINWTDCKRIDCKPNENYMIVVTHNDVDYLEKFLEVNYDVNIRLDEYVGEKEKFILTDEDYNKIQSVLYKYSNVANFIDTHCDLRKKKDLSYENNICRHLNNPYIIDCLKDYVFPCCNANQDKIALDDFNGQLPKLEQCKDCPILLRTISYKNI